MHDVHITFVQGRREWVRVPVIPPSGIPSFPVNLEASLAVLTKSYHSDVYKIIYCSTWTKFCLRSSEANIFSWNPRRVSKRRVGYDQQYYFYHTKVKEYFRTRVSLIVSGNNSDAFNVCMQYTAESDFEKDANTKSNTWRLNFA